MIGVANIVEAMKELVHELSDTVGIIEKNIASYDRIKAGFKYRRVKSRLIEILGELVEGAG